MDSAELSKLRRLAIFAKVLEHGSFSGAAREMGMNRSNVSDQISQLESSLSVRLLHRSTRDLSLTQEGERIYPLAKTILDTLSSIGEELEGDKLAGRVRITTTADFAIQWLTPRLQQFNEQYPDILFDLVISDNEVNLVKEQIDLAIRISPHVEKSQINRVLFEDSLSIIAAPGFFSGKTDKASIENATWFILQQTVDTPEVNLNNTQTGEALSFVPKRFHICDSPMVMRRMIMNGMGIGLHLPKTVEQEMANNQLELVLPEWRGMRFYFFLTYVSNQQLALRIKCLVMFLRKQTDNQNLVI